MENVVQQTKCTCKRRCAEIPGGYMAIVRAREEVLCFENLQDQDAHLLNELRRGAKSVSGHICARYSYVFNINAVGQYFPNRWHQGMSRLLEERLFTRKCTFEQIDEAPQDRCNHCLHVDPG